MYFYTIKLTLFCLFFFSEGHLIVAQLILDSGALVNVPSGSENNIPLTLACWKGHTDVVELLLDHNSDKEHRNKAGCTPLMLAAREGHLATTKLLLDRGAEVNTPSGSNDDTPLTLACWKGHHEVVALLLKHESAVDHQTKTGCTPLMEATREGHVKVVKLLLENGADVELPDNYGQSPLFMACWKGHRDVAELLLKYNANRECRTKTGITPLFQACRENHVTVVELLLDQGASVSASFPNSRENPMTLAAEKGYVELVELLLNRGGNVDCRTKKGCSPFFLACKEGHLEIARSLYKNSADIEVCDQRNISPLVAAFRNGHHKVVEWILSIAKHVPSDEQCQKCITAPLEGKDSDRDLLYLRTTCYEMIKKAKKVKEQAAFLNAESFLQELEEDKVREENKKKRQAAKRRDKRKKKKKLKESEQRNSVPNVDPLPSENRTYNDTNEEDNTCSEEETSRMLISTRLSNDVSVNREHAGNESEIFKHVTHCRAKTVGQALGEKGNKNSTEETRDDQPQAVFDANDNQEATSPQKKKEVAKTPHKIVNTSHSVKVKQAHRSPDANDHGESVNVTKEEQISSFSTVNLNVEKNVDISINGKIKLNERLTGSTEEFASKPNGLKIGIPIPNNDAYLKENGKVNVSRTKQSTVSGFINCWKEVTKNSSSKVMIIQLTAPNALCGRVIGRGGTKINGITDESGAQITIGKPDPKTPNDRVITIKGTGKAVQKAKLLVSQALNTPSGATQVQTPNLSSSPPLTNIQRQTTSSVAPIRGNFAAIPSSSAEWPTVAQAHRIGSTTCSESSHKTHLETEQTAEKTNGDMRETRANSAPEIFSETEGATGSERQKISAAEVATLPPIELRTMQPGSCHRVVSTAGENSSSCSSSIKTRTKSYALTQDTGNRLSYCEVATGIENGFCKVDEMKKATSSIELHEKTLSSQYAAGCSVARAENGYVDECDNVFADDDLFPEMGVAHKQFNGNDVITAVKEQVVACNPWSEEIKVQENDTRGSIHLNVNDPSRRKPMDILPPSSSLFTGAQWPNREHIDSDKTRSVSWSDQDFCESEEHATPDDNQSSQPDIGSLSSHSIWSPVQPKVASVGALSDNEPFEGIGWGDNSNSASSSRSSSRLELSSIMENEKNTSFPQTSPPYKANDVDAVERSGEEYQSSWLSTRGAHSAPSSPSLVRSRDQRLKLSRPITAQSNSYDDMSDRLWSRRTDTGSCDTNWNDEVLQNKSNAYRNHVSEGDQGNLLNSSPKLGSFKQYEPPNVNKWSDPLLERTVISEVLQLLERLSLTKYNQTFEENYITMEKLSNMTDTDLQKIGIPKGPRLKIMHAIPRGNNGMTNGTLVSNKTVNDRVSGSVPVPDVLSQVPVSGSLLNHLQIDSRVPSHTFPSVLPNTQQMLQKQQTETLNPLLLSYNIPNSSVHTHHSLLSLDPGSVATHSPHGHMEQQINGLPPQQQYIMSSVHNDQYDPQNSYLGPVPYQQPMFYTRQPGPYYYYP